MTSRRPVPPLAIIGLATSLGLALRELPLLLRPTPPSAIPAVETANAEDLLARGECIPSRLLRDPRTTFLLPVASRALAEMLSKEASGTPFELRTRDELRSILEAVPGIGPKRSALLLPLICSRD
jgi:hypothetical protein